jgi:acetyl-CoA C-acetyltransferase
MKEMAPRSPRSLDPRTPVLVGGGQVNQRDQPAEPADMIVEAIRAAAADAAAPHLAELIESIRVVGMLSWRYRDPGRLAGDRLGALVRHTVYTGNGGSHPQALVNDAAEDVAAGRCDVVAVGGAEAWRTRMALRRRGERPVWTVQADDVPAPETRPDVPMHDTTEMRAGLDRPAYVYPLFEQALRISAARTTGEHIAAISRLWARFSEVAAANPAAWSPVAVTAEAIAAPGPRNRLIAWPYTKLMNSNNDVDQAAAVIICSAEAAARFGVPKDRWVFPLAGAEASDTAQVAARHRLDASPAIRHAGRLALDLAGVDLAGIGLIDLYSCFPSAVQVAARELGLPPCSPDRPLTVTGGLTFAGGPWSNYSTHAIVAMMDKVRQTGQLGLVTANSGYLTRHSIGVYAPAPGPGFRRGDAQPTVAAEPTTPVAAAHDGPAILESWTVVFDRDGRPEAALAALRTPDGPRVLARSDEPEIAQRLITEDAEGTPGTVSPDASFRLK